MEAAGRINRDAILIGNCVVGCPAGCEFGLVMGFGGLVLFDMYVKGNGTQRSDLQFVAGGCQQLHAGGQQPQEGGLQPDVAG